MKISTEIGSIAACIGEEAAVFEVARAGFDAFDFSMCRMARYDWKSEVLLPNAHPLANANYLSFARRIRQIGADNGIVCNQSHAPFPTQVPGIRDMLKRAIECTAEAGGSICVIHPVSRDPVEKNAALYQELLPFARACGVTIAAENMWTWNREKTRIIPGACSTPAAFLELLQAVNDPALVACLDIGHAEMQDIGTSAPAMIRALGPHLQALHLHDNDRYRDTHLLPMTGAIDFRAITAALREVNYSGYFTLEADRHCAGCSPEVISEKVAEMAHCARKLTAMFASDGNDTE